MTGSDAVAKSGFPEGWFLSAAVAVGSDEGLVLRL